MIVFLVDEVVDVGVMWVFCFIKIVGGDLLLKCLIVCLEVVLIVYFMGDMKVVGDYK